MLFSSVADKLRIITQQQRTLLKQLMTVAYENLYLSPPQWYTLLNLASQLNIQLWGAKSVYEPANASGQNMNMGGSKSSLKYF